MHASSAYVHGLAPARRADQQDVVGAGGRDLEGALGVRLAADVGEVEIVRRGPGGRERGGGRGGGGLAVEEPGHPPEGPRQASATAGVPRTGWIWPSSASSPTTAKGSDAPSRRAPVAARTPRAIGRSKAAASLRRAAGAGVPG